MATRANLPSLTEGVRDPRLPPGAQRAIEALQQAVRDIYDGTAARRGQLLASGVAPGGGLFPGETVDPPGEVQDLSPPPAPKNLTAAAGYGAVLLRWDPDVDPRIGYAEVLRATTDNPGAASVIGTAAGNLFTDSPGAGATYYYWVRHVNKWNPAVKSSLNATSGTEAITSEDIDFLLEALTGAEGDKPFYEVPAPIEIDGIEIPAGIYIKQAWILDAVVKTFRAGLAVIDSASIISLTADKVELDSLVARLAQISEGQFGTIFANKAFLSGAVIGASGIRSSNFNGNPATDNPGTAGWYIGPDGKLYLNNIVARGNIEATSVAASTTITAPNITTPTVSAGEFTSSVLKNANGTRWLALDGLAGYILNTPYAKILDDGSTRFSNVVASGNWAPGLSGTQWMWNGQAAGNAPHLVSGAEYMGEEEGGWLRYLIDTGHDEPWTSSIAGTFSVRFSGGSIFAGASVPSAGEYMMDLEVDGAVAMGVPMFRSGASPNYASDPLNRSAGYTRIYVILRARPALWVTDNFIRIESLDWTVYRIT